MDRVSCRICASVTDVYTAFRRVSIAPVGGNDMRRPWVMWSLLLIASVAMVVNPFHRDHQVNVISMVVSQALILVWVFAYTVRRLRRSSRKLHLSHVKRAMSLIQVDDQRIQTLRARAAFAGLDSFQAKIFAFSMLKPAELRQRVVERYSPGQRTLEQEVTVEAQVPGELFAKSPQPSDIMFPVLIPPKGELHDNLDIFDAAGDRLSPLSYREYLYHVSGTLRALFQAIQNADPKQLLDKRALRDAERRAMKTILYRVGPGAKINGILSVDLAAHDGQEVAASIEELTRNVGEAQNVAKFLIGLVRLLATNYAIVVRVPIDEHGRIFMRYTRTLVPEVEPTGRHLAKLRSWLRVLLGARPVDVTVSLDNAWTCQSYHARVAVPDGLYLAHQSFDAPKAYFERTAEGAPTPLHYRLRRRLGQPYAHLYGRFFPAPEAGERRPKLQLSFHEMPPGSSFRAVLTGAACLALVWLVGLIVSHPVPVPVSSSQGGPVQMSNSLPAYLSQLGTDVPAFLLAFPAVAAGLLGIEAQSPRLFEGSLAARLSLATTALLSVSASGLFLLNRAGFSFFEATLPNNITVLGITRAFWAILVAAALLNTAYATHRWFSCASEFKYLSGRPEDDR